MGSKHNEESFTAARQCVDLIVRVQRETGLGTELLYQVLQELDHDPGDFLERLHGAATDWDT
jgi:hypothetical protein